MLTGIQLRKLWVSILNVGARLPLHPNAKLRVMEDILCAGFQSRSKSIATLTIAAWNRAFGSQDMLEYPERLRGVLARLRQHTEIDVLAFKLSETSAVSATNDEEIFLWLASSNESQHIDAPRTSAPATITPRKPFHMAGRSPKPASAVSTPSKTAPQSRQSAISTPPARLRHDDSQIQFVAVESSPIGPPQYDSQLLTDHQKEVKTRQRADIAIFSDIRSSPVQETQQTTLPATAITPSPAEDAGAYPQIHSDNEVVEEEVHRMPAADVAINSSTDHEMSSGMDEDKPTPIEEQTDHTEQADLPKFIEDLGADVTVTEDVSEADRTIQPQAEQFELEAIGEGPAREEAAEAHSDVAVDIASGISPAVEADPPETTDLMDIDEAPEALKHVEHDDPLAESSDIAARINDAAAQPSSDDEDQDVTVMQDNNAQVSTTPYVLIEQPVPTRRKSTDIISASARKRSRSDANDECIVVKQKKPNSPSLLTLLQKSSSSQRSPNTSFTSPATDSPARSSPRKRAAAQVEDDVASSRMIQRAAKRRRSGRLSQNQCQEAEHPSQSQDSPSQSQPQSQSSQRKSSRLSGNTPTLATGLSTPRHQRRRPRKLVDSTATDIRTPSHSPQKRVLEEDEDELSQDVVPDTALPPNTPASQRSYRGSKLGEFPASVSTSPGPSSFVVAAETSPTKRRAPSSWDASTVDISIHRAGIAHAKRASQDGANTSPLMAPDDKAPAVSSPSTPRASTAQPATSPSGSIARGLIGRLYDILADCKTLVLGPSERKQREELEDVTHELQRELTRAVRRGNA